MFISVIIPCYNEIKTISQIIDKIINLKNLKIQIIIVDDASTDGTAKVLKDKIEKLVDKVVYHEENIGKGGAIKSSLKFINGDFVIIQDADLEYDPEDYFSLLDKFNDSRVNVVYGSRTLKKKYFNYKSSFKKNFRVFGNLVLTSFSNFFNQQKLTDAHTCYKVFRKDLFLKLNLQENDFAFCPEVTTKLSILKEKIHEIPINYDGREIEDGKKIAFFDAIIALKTIIKYRFFIKP